MPQRYVQLPNGSYLEWPENVSADEFKAKALKVMGQTPAAPETAVDKMFPEGGTVSAPHPRTGLAGMEDSLSSLRTRLSAFAQKGVGPGVGDFMESLPLGLLKMAKGGTEVPQGKVWKGTKDMVGGGLEASTIPASFVAPEASEAAGKLLPSTERAGQLFQELEKIAGKVPVNVNEPGKVATKIWDLAQAGGSRPKIVNDFLRRVTNPQGLPMDYSEMRKFYQNATRLSADEANRLTPNVKRLIGEFTQRLGDSLWEAAQSVGEGGKYNTAMKSYRTAARLKNAKDAVVPWAIKGGAGVLGAGAGYKLGELLGIIPRQK
jgi:hypothetical protein